MRIIFGLFIFSILFQAKCFSASDTTNNPIDIKIKVDTEYFVNHEKSYYNIVYRDEQYDITSDSAKEKRFPLPGRCPPPDIPEAITMNFNYKFGNGYEQT